MAMRMLRLHAPHAAADLAATDPTDPAAAAAAGGVGGGGAPAGPGADAAAGAGPGDSVASVLLALVRTHLFSTGAAREERAGEVVARLLALDENSLDRCIERPPVLAARVADALQEMAGGANPAAVWAAAPLAVGAMMRAAADAAAATAGGGAAGAAAGFPATEAGGPDAAAAAEARFIADVRSLPPGDFQRRMKGECLYPVVHSHLKACADAPVELAGKVTGMLLELDLVEVAQLIYRASALASRVAEALRVLRQAR